MIPLAKTFQESIEKMRPTFEAVACAARKFHEFFLLSFFNKAFFISLTSLLMRYIKNGIKNVNRAIMKSNITIAE